MRLLELFLVEYKRDITIQKLGDKLVQAAQRDRNQDIDTIVSSLEDMDPTKNKQYVEWLCRQYIKNMFRLEDKPRIFTALTNFGNIKSRLPTADINRYDLYSLEDVIDKAHGNTDEVDTGVFEVPADTEVIYNGPLGLLVIPQTMVASQILGKGTKWCTASADAETNLFDSYSNEGPLYIWRDKSGKKFQFHIGTENVQFMNDKDIRISRAQCEQFRQHPVLSKLFREFNKKMLSNPLLAVRFAQNIWGRWPEAEPTIMKDPHSAFMYAQTVIKGRWPEAEPVIMQKYDDASSYAQSVIKDRWPEAEPVIMKNARAAYEYARCVIKGRWPEAEPVIMTEPHYAIVYAQIVIKDRWPEAEPIIMKKPGLAVQYAQFVIKGRWPEAEPVIITNPYDAVVYATYAIKGRWPEAEPIIVKSSNLHNLYDYARYVIKGRWPEAEPAMRSNPGIWERYKNTVGMK